MSARPQTPATLRLHLWLETDRGMLLGLGRAMLLAKVAELGSLNKAAKAMNMSYRAAWGRLKAAETLFGRPLTEKGEGRNLSLTPEAQELVRIFLDWHDDVEAYALDSARKRLPWAVQPHPEARPRPGTPPTPHAQEAP